MNQFPKLPNQHWYRFKTVLAKWWRACRGIIRLEFSACRCTVCGSVDAYWRLRCLCWRRDNVPPPMCRMEYGWLIEQNFAGDKFMTNALLYETVKFGVHVQHPDGRRVTIEEFDGEDI